MGPASHALTVSFVISCQLEKNIFSQNIISSWTRGDILSGCFTCFGPSFLLFIIGLVSFPLEMFTAHFLSGFSPFFKYILTIITSNSIYGTITNTIPTIYSFGIHCYCLRNLVPFGLQLTSSFQR